MSGIDGPDMNMSIRAISCGRERTLGASRCLACVVRNRSFCSALDRLEIAALEEIVDEVRLAPNQSLFYERDPADHVFNILSGTVKSYKLLQDGRRQILGFLMPGELIGHAALDRYDHGAEAITEVALCRFPRARLRAISARFPQLERKVLEITANELRAAHEQMLILGRKTAHERIAAFLLQLSAKRVREDLPPDPLLLPMNRHDIADYLGLTAETVSRVLTQFTRNGLISIPQPDVIRFNRPDELEELAQAEDLRIG